MIISFSFLIHCYWIFLYCVFFSMDSVCPDLNIFCAFSQSFSSVVGIVLQPFRSVSFLYCVTVNLKHLGYEKEICASIQQMADNVGTLCDWTLSH